ncbi:MAG TPA: hypothetical protein VGM27_03960, partial [Acidobacteriaceae bacterium]
RTNPKDKFIHLRVRTSFLPGFQNGSVGSNKNRDLDPPGVWIDATVPRGCILPTLALDLVRGEDYRFARRRLSTGLRTRALASNAFSPNETEVTFFREYEFWVFFCWSMKGALPGMRSRSGEIV